MHRHAIPGALVALVAGSTSPALATAPPFSVTSVARSGQQVVDVGPINMIPAAPNSGRGIWRVAVNSSAAWAITIDTPSVFTDEDEALLRSELGLDPYIVEGVPGFLSVPNPTAIARSFLPLTLNDSGNAGITLGLTFDAGMGEGPSSGVYFNNSALIAIQGGAVTAAGVAPGSVWGSFGLDTWIDSADGNLFLVNSNVIESGSPRRMIILIQTDSFGNVLSQTLIAKEDPSGGPGAWASLAGGPHSAAVNSSGAAAFSGVTNGGTRGVFRGGSFVATEGGPSPIVGRNWGELVGTSLDINNAGTVVFRGLSAAGNGVFNEPAPDGGEGVNDSVRTTGNGPMSLIAGSLSDDHDVDIYRLVVTDAASFSASTVPDPGAGFPGAAFDTVLTLMAEPGNGGRGVIRCDDVAPGVPQSTLTGGVITGREYLLAVSTPKSSAQSRQWEYSTNATINLDAWQSDPGAVVHHGGVLYWPDPSHGVIRRVTTGGVPLADIAAPQVTTSIAILNAGAGSKIYWIDRSPKIRRANLDGTGAEDVVTTVGFGTLTASEGTGLAVDGVNGQIFWSRRRYGEITRANLDGTMPERVFKIYLPDGVPPANANFAPTRLAVDPAGNKIYWINRFLDRIERSSPTGTGRETLPVGAGAADLVLDLGAGKVYWSVPSLGLIRRSNLDGTAQEDVLATAAPVGLSLDAGSAVAYWSNPTQRVLRSSPIAAPLVSDVAFVEGDFGQRAPDGPGASEAFWSWQRLGPPSGPAAAYQVRLTGATFEYPEAVIAKGNTKVVASGDAVGIAGTIRIASVSGIDHPLKISDRGDVLWHGVWHADSIYDNYAYTGMFLNTDPLLTVQEIPPTTGGQRVTFFWTTAQSFDMSDDGRYALIATNMQDPPYNFTPQRDNALLLEFDINDCPADFNGVNGVTVQDIYDFLAAWSAGEPSADFNGVNGVTVQDIYDFLAAWSVGCA